MTIKNVFVIGSGIMGSGIAQLIATHGYKVNLVDLNKVVSMNIKLKIN